MAQAVALLVPSEFEQWGLVVNEAWMAPTLVLGSDTVGALRAAYKPEMHWMMMPPVMLRPGSALWPACWLCGPTKGRR